MAMYCTIIEPSTSSSSSGRDSPTSARKSFFKKKIEMCKNILQGNECPFGDKCVFAHKKEELQLTKLKERHEAGLLDANTYRTRPCFDHVCTGSCPFGDRCTSIHDTNIDGSCSAWLPRINNLNALPTDKHIDWNSNYNFQLVHYGTPFGSASQDVFSSFDAFRETVCNRNSIRSIRQCTLSQCQRLEIALDMTATISSHKGSTLKYKPGHFVYGKLCMIAQTKAYDIGNDSAVEIPLVQAKQDDPNHITVYELVFAHNLSGDDIAPSLWFNIPPTEITECSHKEQLKYNRKKARAKDVLHIQNQQATSTKEQYIFKREEDRSTMIIKFAPGDEAFEHHHQHVEPAFAIFYPGNDALSSLISATMRLELDSLRRGDNFSYTPYTPYTHNITTNANLHKYSSLQDNKSNDNILCLELTLRQEFEAIKSHFIMSYWPVNMDRQFVTDDTPVPAVDSTYNIRDDGIHRNLWQAFVCGLNPHTSTEESNCLMTSICRGESDAGLARTKRRLGVFERMTSSFEETKECDAHVPLICSVNDLKLTKNADIAPAPLCKDFDDHWDLIKSFYKNRL